MPWFPDENCPGSERFSNLSQVTEKPEGTYVVGTPRPQLLTLTETLNLDELLDEGLRWVVGMWRTRCLGGSREAYGQHSRQRAAAVQATGQVYFGNAEFSITLGFEEKMGTKGKRKKWSL